MKAAFFLVNICWLASPMTPAPNLVLGGSLMNIVQKSVASITGSVPFLAEWAITSLRNAANSHINNILDLEKNFSSPVRYSKTFL